MSLRLRVLLRKHSEQDAEAIIAFTGDRADLAAQALAEWLSEEVPELLFPEGTPTQNPLRN